jgi:hypothetical protein
MRVRKQGLVQEKKKLHGLLEGALGWQGRATYLLRLMHGCEGGRQVSVFDVLNGRFATGAENDARIVLLIGDRCSCRVDCDDVLVICPSLHALLHCCSSIHCAVNNNCNSGSHTIMHKAQRQQASSAAIYSLTRMRPALTHLRRWRSCKLATTVD